MTALDVIYVAASARDARFTRICIASVRAFYPRVPTKILCGSALERGLLDELHKYWAVDVADVARGDYGWGFVKLEPLFGPKGLRFLVIDSDTVFTGPILDAFTADAVFLVDDERQSEIDTHRLYYDWRKVATIDAAARKPQFVFNTGQWFGTRGILTRDDFAPWIDWSMPRRLKHPDYFMPGEQGILNYVLNQKAVLGELRVERKPIMRWPGHGMGGLTAAAVTAGTAPAAIVHWAGVKKLHLSAMPGADILALFERRYSAKLPLGGFLRRARAFRYFWSAGLAHLSLRIKLRLQQLRPKILPLRHRLV